MARIKKSEEENTEQVQTPPLGEIKKPTPKKKNRDWHKIIDTYTKIASNWLTLFALLVSIVTLMVVTYNAYLSRKSIEISEKNFRKDLPAEFIIIFSPSENSEAIKMQNVSRVEAQDINLAIKFYYVISSGKILTRKSVEDVLNKNDNVLKKFQAANLLKYPKDLDYLLGKSRNLSIGEIEPEGTRIFDDFSSLTIENAIRISQLLGSELVARVRIDYKIKETLKRQTDYKYIWIHGYKPNQTVGRENLTREDLLTVIGGKKVIENLQNFEETTKEVIFSEIENSDIFEETKKIN